MRTPERVREYNRTYYLKHQEERLRYNKEYHQQNAEAVRQRQNQSRLAIIARLGNVCVRCGFSDIRALQVDHIHGGGAKHARSLSSGPTYYKNILNDPNFATKFQCLCANCNWIKRSENNECLPLRQPRKVI